MKPQFYIADDRLHKIGEKAQLQALFEIADYGAVFEDDGDTGYFYLLDEDGVIDALHIYNADEIADRDIPANIVILANESCTIFALAINDVIFAIFDTEKKFGKNLSAFPEVVSDWILDKNRELTDEIIANYFDKNEE